MRGRGWQSLDQGFFLPAWPLDDTPWDMHEPGGTPGGLQKFGLGLLLSALSFYWIGLAIFVIKILSRTQFLMSIKISHPLFMLATLAAGAGLMLQSYRDESALQKEVASR